MKSLLDYDGIIERKILFYNLYKIYYDRVPIKITSKNSLIYLRDELITSKYKIIPDVIYVNKKPIIKKFMDTSFKEKIIHHLTYFYLNEINLNEINRNIKNKKEFLAILKGDIEFINISFNLLKNIKDIRVLEYMIIYELIETISNYINLLEAK